MENTKLSINDRIYLHDNIIENRDWESISTGSSESMFSLIIYPLIWWSNTWISKFILMYLHKVFEFLDIQILVLKSHKINNCEFHNFLFSLNLIHFSHTTLGNISSDSKMWPCISSLNFEYNCSVTHFQDSSCFWYNKTVSMFHWE